MTRPLYVYLFALAIASSLYGCKKEVAPPAPPSVEQKEVVPEQESPKKTKKEAPKENIPVAVFGIPTPPDAYGFIQYTGYVTLMTTRTVEELKEFYTPLAKDFEVVENKEELLLVGLREHMGSAVFMQTTPNASPLKMVLSQLPDIQKKGGTSAEGEGRPGRRARKAPAPMAVSHRGKPVELKNEAGELLAPGARWGEPYTPPEGSYYHQPQFEMNWGQPFGEWTPI